jgi:uncharacterized membrane protein YfcA
MPAAGSWVLVCFAAIVFASFLVGTVAGFGTVVLVVALGALLADVGWMLGWVIPLSIVFYLVLLAISWQHLDWRLLLQRLLPSMAPGIVLGAVASLWLTPALLKLLFGVFVLGVGLWQVRDVHRSPGALRPLSNGVRRGMLFLGGLVQGAYASGGPMVVFVASREPHDKHTFRATLNALWIASTVVLVPKLLLDHSLDAGTARMAAWMLVPMVAGVVLGNRLHATLDARRFRLVVAWTLVVAAVPLTVSAARLLRS